MLFIYGPLALGGLGVLKIGTMWCGWLSSSAPAAITGQGMTRPAIMRAFFTGQPLAHTAENVAALRWYQVLAKNVLERYAAAGYTGAGVATQTKRLEEIAQQLAAWGVK